MATTPIVVPLAIGLSFSLNPDGTITMSGSGITATSTPGTPIIPLVPSTTLQKILAIVEAALPAISTVIPIAGPIAGLVAVGIQLVENLFGKKAGAAKLQTVTSAVKNAVILHHSTIPSAPPLPAGWEAVVERMVQQSVDVSKSTGALP